MAEYQRPPIGVAPWWFHYPKRVVELSEAITRYAEFSAKRTLIRNTAADYKLMRQWAVEIEKISEAMILVAEGYDNG